MKLFLAIVLLSTAFFANAQSPLFKSGEKVCFVGNSITNNGEFYHNIYLYYVTRFPTVPILFFNCGISGDVCSGVLKRMDSDILIHQPNHVVLMLGMNDVSRGLYGKTPTTNEDTLKKREEAFATYKVLLDSIIRIFLVRNIKVILEKPTIFDQTAAIKQTNCLGVNDALKRCADYIQTLSDKYHLPAVDYWSILNNINTELQKKDPTATIIGADRVHPAAPGHLIMAYQFLKTTNMPQYVAEIILDKNSKNSNKKSNNCLVTNFVNGKEAISCTIKENALPFPTTDNQKQGLELVPFINELSVEKFVWRNRIEGQYQFMIDTSLIGSFSGTELAKGINLAQYHNTPQYRQAEKVKAILDKLWKNVASVRTIDYVEISHLGDFKGNRDDLAALKAYLDNRFTTKLSTNNFYKMQFDTYLKIKPNRTQLEEEIETLRAEAYKIAQPMEHKIKIIKIN
jgi:endoglucanase